MLTDSRIETLLRQCTRFRRLVHVPSCPSTQDLAAAAPADDEAVFWADHQTRGRGRQSHVWNDEPGADLAVTFRVRIALPQPLTLPAALPVAVLQALEPRLPRTLRLKWPNDLFLDGRKLCGVLIDAGVVGRDSYLVGVGVNCNRTRFPPELEASATSVALATGELVDRGQLLVDLAVHLDTMLQDLAAQRHAALEAVFGDRLGLLGQRVVVDATPPQTGILQHVDFQQVTLDEGRQLPLATVGGLRRA